MSARRVAVGLATVAALVGGCGDDGPQLLPTAATTDLVEAFIALEVASYRMGRSDSLPRY